MLYNYIVKGHDKAELIGTIEDQIFSTIAELDDTIADICSDLFDTDNIVELRELHNFLTDLINELQEQDFYECSEHYLYTQTAKFTIRKASYYWLVFINNNFVQGTRCNTLVDVLDLVATL